MVTVTEKDGDSGWTVVEGRLDERLAWIRLRSLVSEASRKSRPNRLTIRWEYPDDGDAGMPPVVLRDRFRALEEALVTSLDSDDSGALVLVTTAAGAREWHVHFADKEAVQQCVNAAFAKLPNMPITLSQKSDSDWSEYDFYSSALSDQ